MIIEEGYIDTCVLAAYYCPESLSNKAEELLLSIKKPVISLLTEIELMSVLSRKLRKKEIAKKAVEQILTTYTMHVKEGYYHKIPVKTEHYLHARDLLGSFKYTLNSLDTLHLTTAMSENIPLITIDKNLAKAAKKMKAKVYLLT